MAQLVHQEINANCVNLILEDGVDHFQKQGTEVVLESGMVLQADLVIFSDWRRSGKWSKQKMPTLNAVPGDTLSQLPIMRSLMLKRMLLIPIFCHWRRH